MMYVRLKSERTFFGCQAGLHICVFMPGRDVRPEEGGMRLSQEVAVFVQIKVRRIPLSALRATTSSDRRQANSVSYTPHATTISHEKIMLKQCWGGRFHFQFINM